ncbi:MAG: ScyD/ScyE family protein [Gemmatimonadota bacterium]|jgi:hypothetical protein
MRKLLLLSTLALTLVACSDSTGPVSLDRAPDALANRGGPPAPAAYAEFTLSAPVFGLSTAPDGSLTAAEGSAGLTELRKGAASLLAELPGVSGVDHVGRGDLFAVTGEAPEGVAPGSQSLFRVSHGNVRMVADLLAFEEAVNPDQVWNPLPPESNPFNVAHVRGGQVLVADAAANAILMVESDGDVDWVAVLPPQPLPFNGGVIPAQPVATSVAVGPDGAYYAGELKGFPGTPGNSKVWRIEAGTRRTVCPSAECTMVLDGLTSIVDLEFGPDGTLYVAELDAASWLATETPTGIQPAAGGTVKACDVDAGTCAVMADGLDLPAGLAVGKDGTVWVAENSSIPGVATVRAIGP